MKNKKGQDTVKVEKESLVENVASLKKLEDVEEEENMRGGSTMNYSVIDSGLKGNDARILGSHSYTTTENCGDGYNHFTGGKSKSLY